MLAIVEHDQQLEMSVVFIDRNPQHVSNKVRCSLTVRYGLSLLKSELQMLRGAEMFGHLNKDGWSRVVRGPLNKIISAGSGVIFCALNATLGVAGGMALPGGFSVNQGGAATYSIPIVIPPGSGGVTPSLSLDYNSMGANGLVGVGWSLGGLPAIGRCPRTIAQDGVGGGVSYDSNDRFCLDGQRLVSIAGAYGADGTEYRTEIDSYSKIISHGSAGTGPAWFEVRTKSGQLMEFGHSGDSQVLAEGKATARNWAVNKVSDTKGNYFVVTYTVDQASGQFFPAHVDYTGNTAAAVSPYNTVQFVYATRPDSIQQYQAGSVMRTLVRLTNIKTLASGNLVSDYRISYGQSPSSNDSEVTSIAVCGASGDCLPATSFQWASGGGDTLSGASMTNPLTGGATLSTHNAWSAMSVSLLGGSMGASPVFMDLNGDGKSDMVLVYGTSVYSWLSNGDGTYTVLTSTAPNGWNFTPFQSHYVPFVGDFNSDGYSDFAYLNAGYVYVFLNAGNGAYSGVTFPCPNNWNFGSDPTAGFSFISGDFNGDGRSDFLAVSGAYVFEFLSNGDGTFQGVQIQISNGWNFSTTPSAYFLPISGDFNGDGKTDFVMLAGAYIYEFLNNGDGSFTYNTIQIPNGWNFGTPPSSYMSVVGDFNGDGKTDWVLLNGATLYEFQSKGDGSFLIFSIAISNGWNFGAQPAASYQLYSGDFNLDGRLDFALFNLSYPYVYQFTSNADGTFNYRTMNSWTFGAPPYLTVGGDFNGDGRTDFLTMNFSSIFTITANGSIGDVVTGVTTGLGAATTITYKALTDSAVYTKDSGGTYPTINLKLPLHVVSRVDVSNGVGGAYSSSYSYAGAKADLTGRGMLGFSHMTVTDLQTGISDTTTFRQDFPYIGMVASTTRTYGTQTLGQSTNTFQFSNATGAATISPAVAPYRVSLVQNISSGSDLDGSALPTVTTANQYDAYGNATRVTVSTPDGYSKTTVNTYSNDPSLWYLGRLIRATVTSVRPQ
ncbi:FG-GAP-like repeat-containing protein [Bradyrhizobium sp. STM 3809]|uniref:FG-GAP-like repeat-containing protein n=1 Tax=Bradyrhizobium sp. STM 3809 TaxID=551936 RepID=UPI001F0B2F3A|nr:FG-GAP-like repeat-containing protein [Bradyrhizobium sp. STM 3809]